MTADPLRKVAPVLICALASTGARPYRAPAPRVQILVNGDEAEAVLDILVKRGSGRTIQDDDWDRLFRTEPYVRLKEREAGLDRAFTDDAFKEFLLSPELPGRAAELRPTLQEWKQADLAGDAVRLLPYLPGDAVIRTKVYLVIKRAGERTRWDHDMDHFDRDLRKIEKFFLDVLHGRLKTREEVDRVGFSFFGEQGPWYTVGYRMAVTIERQEGRARLIECMRDARRLLPAYNRAATARNAATREKLALWSAKLIDAIESNTP